MADYVTRFLADTRGIRQGSREAERAVARFARSARRDLGLADRAGQNLSQNLIRNFRSGALGLLGFEAARRTAAALVSAADEITNIQNRLQAARATATLEDVVGLSNQTLTSIQASGVLVSRIALTTQGLNISQERQLSIARAIQQTYALSGATIRESVNSTIQFTQGLASNRLAGDELRGVLEGNARLSRALAEGLGLSGVGELREQAEAGALTTDRVLSAIENQAAGIDADFQNLTRTFGQTWQVAANGAQVFSGEIVNLAADVLGVREGLIGAGEELSEYAQVVRTIRDYWNEAAMLARSVPSGGDASEPRQQRDAVPAAVTILDAVRVALADAVASGRGYGTSNLDLQRRIAPEGLFEQRYADSQERAADFARQYWEAQIASARTASRETRRAATQGAFQQAVAEPATLREARNLATIEASLSEGSDAYLRAVQSVTGGTADFGTIVRELSDKELRNLQAVIQALNETERREAQQRAAVDAIRGIGAQGDANAQAILQIERLQTRLSELADVAGDEAAPDIERAREALATLAEDARRTPLDRARQIAGGPTTTALLQVEGLERELALLAPVLMTTAAGTELLRRAEEQLERERVDALGATDQALLAIAGRGNPFQQAALDVALLEQEVERLSNTVGASPEAIRAANDALEEARAAAERAPTDAVRGILGQSDPAVAALLQIEEQERQLAKLRDSGKVSAELIGEAEDSLARRRMEAEQASGDILRGLLAQDDPELAARLSALQRAEELQRALDAAQKDKLATDEEVLEAERQIARERRRGEGDDDSALMQYSDAVRGGLQTALLDSVRTGDFSEFGESVLGSIADSLFQASLNNLFDSIFADVLGGTLGFGGGRQFGGPVRPGQFYTVGEAGPEVLVPTVSGTVLDIESLGGRGDRIVTVNQEVYGDQTAEQQRALVRNASTIGEVANQRELDEAFA